jgi:hypothetical protein
VRDSWNNNYDNKGFRGCTRTALSAGSAGQAQKQAAHLFLREEKSSKASLRSGVDTVARQVSTS